MPYSFGPFELDPELFELRRDGVPVSIQRKAFDLLLYLIQNEDVVCTKKQILGVVWPDVVVTETALTQVMMTLRRTLGDDDAVPKYIQTVRGRGYRFVASLDGAREPSAAEPRAPGAAIGRDEELRAITHAFAEARSGRSSVVLLGGGPGMGKSYLCAEAATIAATPPALEALVVRCDAPAGAPPFLPWLTLVKRLAPDREAPAARDPFGWLEIVLTTLREASSNAPLAIVLDDVHCMDPASTRVLSALASEIEKLPLAVVMTYRHTGPRPAEADPIDAFARLASAHVFDLRPLTREETARFVENAVGAAQPDAVVARVHEKTGGSPLLLRQIAHVLRAEAALERPHDDRAGTTALLGGAPLKGAIAAHVAALPERTREVLVAGSVFGSDFSVTDVAFVLGLPNDEVLDRLDAALKETVVTKVKGATGVYRFSHALVRDALYRGLTESVRAKLHGAAGRALVERFGDDSLGARAAEVAHHFCASASSGDVELAVRHALAAAEHALANGDPTSAAAHVESAARVDASGRSSADRQRAIEAVRSRL